MLKSTGIAAAVGHVPPAAAAPAIGGALQLAIYLLLLGALLSVVGRAS